MLSRQHSARCEYVFAPRSPYGRGNSGLVQAVAEYFHDTFRRRDIREIRDLVEADKVHPAFQTGQQPDYGIGMTLVIIVSGKHCIFETYAALTGKVVLSYKVHDIFQRVGLLHRHQFSTLIRKRIVHTYRQMAPCLVQISLECRQNSYG